MWIQDYIFNTLYPKSSGSQTIATVADNYLMKNANIGPNFTKQALVRDSQEDLI